MIAGGGPRKTGGSRAISPHQDLEILIWQEHPYCGAMEHIQAIQMFKIRKTSFGT